MENWRLWFVRANGFAIVVAVKPNRLTWWVYEAELNYRPVSEEGPLTTMTGSSILLRAAPTHPANHVNADASTDLGVEVGPSHQIHEILCKLLAEPDGLRVYGNARTPGLFASKTTTTQRLLDLLCEKGWIEWLGENKPPRVRLTTSGQNHLLNEAHPRLLLEDLLRVSERQLERCQEWSSQLKLQSEAIARQSAAIQRTLDRLRMEETNAGPAAPTIPIDTIIASTSSDSPASQPGMPTVGKTGMNGNLTATLRQFMAQHQHDLPTLTLTLPELFHRLTSNPDTPISAAISIGQFHDAIRSLYEAGHIWLTPWTGPLYLMPEPQLALLIGHEVLYYVKLQ